MGNPFPDARKQIIIDLEKHFPDKAPRSLQTPFEMGYMAGALEVIRRLKEAQRGNV